MKEPLRVIEGNTRPFEPFWSFRDAKQTESGETEVEFFGPISEYSWWGDEVTPKSFKDELYAKGKGKPVTVKVNSPGGEVFAASAIRAILQDYPGKVTADIIGLAASAATIVVTGADRIEMRDTAMCMIHDPWTVAIGNADEMRKVVEILDGIKETLINAYELKTGKGREEIAALMSEETWMTADQALAMGFVDEVKEGPKPKVANGALRAGFLNCVGAYEKLPEGMRELFSDSAEEEEVVDTDATPFGASKDAENTDEDLNVPGEAEASAEAEPVADDQVSAEMVEESDAEQDINWLRNYVRIFGPTQTETGHLDEGE